MATGWRLAPPGRSRVPTERGHPVEVARVRSEADRAQARRRFRPSPAAPRVWSRRSGAGRGVMEVRLEKATGSSSCSADRGRCRREAACGHLQKRPALAAARLAQHLDRDAVPARGSEGDDAPGLAARKQSSQARCTLAGVPSEARFNVQVESTCGKGGACRRA